MPEIKETIAELREKLQAEKIAARRGYWGYKLLHRGPSIYITYLLLRTQIRPNHVSVVVLLVGIAGAVLAGLSPFSAKIAGIILLYLNLILDEVDGEIARYKKIFSLRGVYLDAVNHLLVPPLFFASFVLGIARVTSLNETLLLAVGLLGALSWMLIKAGGKMPLHIYLARYAGRETDFNLAHTTGTRTEAATAEKKKVFRTLFAARFQIREFFSGLVIFFFILIGERLFLTPFELATHPWLSYAVIVYGLFLTLMAAEEVIKSFFLIEGRVKNVAEKFPIAR